MERIARFFTLCVMVVAAGALMVLAGCGVATGGAAEGGGTSSGTPATLSTRGVLTPAPSATPSRSPAPATTPAPGSSAGGVYVSVGQPSYSPTDTIVVTVTNGTSHDVFAANHQTACTIVRLERLDGATWTPAGGCDEGTVTTFIPVRAGSSATFHLAPGGGMMKSAPWAAGTYRVAFRYTQTVAGSGGGAPSASFNTVYSATFTVG